MATRESSNSDGTREVWDYDTRLYTKSDASGAQIEQRAFTPEENAEADAYLASQAQETNETTIRTNLTSTQLFDNLRTIGNGTGTFATAGIRDAAIRTCARACVLIIRILARRFDATD